MVVAGEDDDDVVWNARGLFAKRGGGCGGCSRSTAHKDGFITY